jgi:hypothetical protein
LAGQPRFPLPSELVSAPRPPWQYRKAFRNALPGVLGLAVGGLLDSAEIVSSRPLLIIGSIAAFLLLVVVMPALFIRRVVQLVCSRRARCYRGMEGGR